MTNSILLDNDAVLKICGYDLLAELNECLASKSDNLNVLGVARFVVRNAIAKKHDISDRQSALTRFSEFLESAKEVEPTEEEILLAAKLESCVQDSSTAVLDCGESQLIAVLIKRTAKLLLTGDKRAIRAIGPAICEAEYEHDLLQKVACLEQLMVTFVRRYGASVIQPRVCRETKIDKALTICFRCVSGVFDDSTVTDALSSYIAHIRRTAPTVLVETNDLQSVVS